jgi:hypothetical protein
MKPIYTKSLIKDFPELHKQARAGVQSSMHYGFAFGDGWYQIYYEWCAKVAARAAANGIKPDDERYPVVNQVKEKFGGLRIHCSPHSDYADLTNEAVEKAACTCEHCGKPGKMRPGGWYHVGCDRCESRLVEIRAERDAQYHEQERSGGYRKPINDAFAEVDAKAAVGLFNEFKELQIDVIYAASKSVGDSKVVKRESIFDALRPKCKCGINKDVCDRTMATDPDFCRRVNEIKKIKEKENGK